ncbi:hypothetical protein DFH07DRAFT_1062943 [Mycena maculata]|uniref:Uncharacterized protein n=1 Tax=Mycena maculata TaxID=230809 RepID=A0AAD7N6R5_9AGAR|nr:hypothetical protein DFH07DRAFT_1062943 [Mycena maculata]
MAGENPTHIPALDAYHDLEDVHKAAEALGLIVAAFLDDDLLPLDALYTNPEPCRLVLTRHDDLYAMLRESHASRNFSAVRNHRALRRQNGSCEIIKLLSEFLPILMAFIKKGWPKAWSLSAGTVVEDHVHAHIASLGIPDVYGEPSVLFHELGRFSADATLANRVNNIFVKGHHTFLVNTSGSGKTRLAFEGLCQHWGFYLVGAIDLNGIGSADLKHLVETHIGDETTSFREEALSLRDVAENVRLTHHCLRRLLLCRLLVFSMFADHVGITAEHKKMWFLMQALPRSIGPSNFGDIFSMLLPELADADGDYTKDYIHHLLRRLRGSFGENFHMFFVFDEAQVILGKHKAAFREGGESYPILKEMLDGLHGEFERHEISFVTVGTQIPKSGFRNSRNVDRHRWCSDTGAFDDENLHREYVSRYLPPSYVESRAGKAFLRAVWEWCRGRYRFTDALLATLARDGFRSPHSLLNDYIERGTGHRPQKNLEFLRTEKGERADIRITRIDCAALESAACRSLSSTLRDVLFHYSVTGRHPRPFGVDRIEIVDQAFGRFFDGQMSKIVVDEPIMLATVANWFCTNSGPYTGSLARSQRDSFLDVMQLYQPTGPQTFLAALVIYITHAFAQGHPVSKVFSFPHSAVPVWAKQKAEVVALNRPHGRQTWHYVAAHSSAAMLATDPTSPDGLISWLEHDNSGLPPFCLPSMGSPDLIFVLRLAEGTFIQIILQACATSTIIPNSKLREMIQDTDNANLFPFENPALHGRAIAALQVLPIGASATRRPPVLRVIASFPAPAQLKSATNKSTRGVAGLNTGVFKTLAAKIPASEILENMIEAVTGGKSDRKRSAVDSESLETTKRRRTSQSGTGVPTRRSTRSQRG